MMMEAMKPNQSALSMFCANQETWVDMIPQFGLEKSVTLLDGSRIGPWQAGWSTRVPLWLARHLQSKSLGKISPNGDNDNWMQVDLLKRILHHEQTNQTFWMNDSVKKDIDDDMTDKEDEESNSSSRPYLPERYWELSQCYSTADNTAAVSLLLQDIWTLRLNKLQSQFKNVIAEDTFKAINVTGIGSAEMAVMKDVIVESLTYKVALQQESIADKAVGNAKTPPPSRPQRQRANIRRFRGGTVPSGGAGD